MSWPADPGRPPGRPPCGQVVAKERQGGLTYALRFRAYGQRRYRTLGTAAQGWTAEKAQRALRHTLADVERGLWQPAPTASAPPPAAQVPLFAEFAERWLEGAEAELRPSSLADYEWQLDLHLVPFFGAHRLKDITISEVDRYRLFKVREARLSAASINKTITRLAQILEVAVEYELIARNPARGKRRRLKAASPRRAHLDRADHITALLDAAGQLDHEARPEHHGVGRRATLATLLFAGLRIGELLSLRWRDVDLATGRLRIGEAKTDAGIRTVDLLPALRDELAARKATTTRPAPRDLVFATATGRRQGATNIRKRVLAPAVKRANQLLEQEGRAPLPERLTPHGLRHTYASLLVAAGEDPRYVMGQLGHTDPNLTLRLYTHSMRREDGERQRLQDLITGDVARASAADDLDRMAA